MKKRVLMLGAARDVKGGVSTVVNQYYEAGLGNIVDLKYIETMKEGAKVKKLFVAAKAYYEFKINIKYYDIVHIHMASRASFFRKSIFIKLAYKAGKKIIIHMHGAEFDIFYDKECDNKKKKIVNEIFNMADIVIALSDQWKEYLSCICDKKKIIVLYNAVNIPDFRRENYDNKNILFLGRLGKRKGIYDLIEAGKRITEIEPDVHFYVAGDGEIEECKKICIENNLTNHITFLGWIRGREKEEYLKKCSIFVLPSYGEGMPMSVLEAMSYGMIVVSTYVGGIPEIIKHEKNGYLFNPGDVESLVKYILESLEKDKKEYIGKNACKTILHRFNAKKNIVYLKKIYSEL